jgi:tellurite resistance protein TerC
MFHWILNFFVGILLFSAVKFLSETDDIAEVQESWATKQIRGQEFFVVENCLRKATPLFLSLAVTQDAFVAFESNILAILGLRALYFELADWVARLRYLKPGLAANFGFIGIKMLLIDFYKIPSSVSLLVFLGILVTAALSSWYVARVEERRLQSPGGKT